MFNRLKFVIKTVSNDNEITYALKKVLPKTLAALLILFTAIGFDVALTVISVKIKNPQIKRLITEVKKAGLFLAIATLIFVVFASIVTIICALVY